MPLPDSDVMSPNNLQTLLQAIVGGSAKGEEAQAAPVGQASSTNDPPPRLEDFQTPPQHMIEALKAEQARGGFGPRAKQIQSAIDDYIAQASKRHEQAMGLWQQRQNQNQTYSEQKEHSRRRLPFADRMTDIAENLPWGAAGAAAGLAILGNNRGQMSANKVIRGWDNYLTGAEQKMQQGGLKQQERDAMIKGLQAERKTGLTSDAAQNPTGIWNNIKATTPSMVAGAGIGAGAATLPNEIDLQSLPQDSESWMRALRNMATLENLERAGYGGLLGASAGGVGHKVPTIWGRRNPPVGRTEEAIKNLKARLKPRNVAGGTE